MALGRPAPALTALAPHLGAPCRLIAPSTERLDRTRKLPTYARASVVHIWLVNPLARTLEVLRLESGRLALVATHAADEIVRAEPFEAAEVDLLVVWGGTRPQSVG